MRWCPSWTTRFRSRRSGCIRWQAQEQNQSQSVLWGKQENVRTSKTKNEQNVLFAKAVTSDNVCGHSFHATECHAKVAAIRIHCRNWIKWIHEHEIGNVPLLLEDSSATTTGCVPASLVRIPDQIRNEHSSDCSNLPSSTQLELAAFHTASTNARIKGAVKDCIKQKTWFQTIPTNRFCSIK